MPAETQHEGTPEGQTVGQESSLLDQIREQTELAAREVGQTPEEQKEAKEWLDAFLSDVVESHLVISKDTEKMLSARIAEIDTLLSDQLNEVIHSPEFQKLEGSWRGLHYLVDQSETSTSLKIKVLNATRDDLLKDFRSASEFDQSTVWQKIYENEFGMLGGHPFGALIGDYYFGRGPQDMEVLEKMSQVAAAAHAPFISAPSPELFGWKTFTQLSGPGERDLAKKFETDLFTRWRMFRESEDSQYVGLVLPHVLMRLPYGKDSITVDEFNYEEKVDGKDHDKYLWGNAAYAFAARLTDAFAQHEWCAAIRGVEGGGQVEGLPLHTFPTDDGDIALKCPTEIAIAERREFEFSNLGFIPLCHYRGTDKAVFMGAQSAHKAVQYLEPDANASARLSSQLQYILAVSRFAHFLKVILRDKVGSFTSRDTCQAELNNWINHYVLAMDDASQDQKAKFPLREARIEVSEVAGKPGVFVAEAFLRPHFQLDQINIAMHLVARLPESKGQ